MKDDDQNKTEEGDREEPAIETFGSTGRGWVVESVHACMRHRDGDGLELMDKLLTMGTAGGCSDRMYL